MGYTKKNTQQFISLFSYDIAPEHLQALQEQKEAILAVQQLEQKPLATNGFPAQTYWGPSGSEESSQPLNQHPKRSRRADQISWQVPNASFLPSQLRVPFPRPQHAKVMY
jgi:hypothetical protein